MIRFNTPHNLRRGDPVRMVSNSTPTFIEPHRTAGVNGRDRGTPDMPTTSSRSPSRRSICRPPTRRAASTRPAATQNVTGQSIVLAAPNGGTERAAAKLDRDSSRHRVEAVNADTRDDVFLYEDGALAADFGNLNVDLTRSTRIDVSLTTRYGGILDAADDIAAYVVGNTLTLVAERGTPSIDSIGSIANPLESNSSTFVVVGAIVRSASNINFVGTQYEMYVKSIQSTDGDSIPRAVPTTPDTADARSDIMVQGPVHVSSLIANVVGDDSDQNSTGITFTLLPAFTGTTLLRMVRNDAGKSGLGFERRERRWPDLAGRSIPTTASPNAISRTRLWSTTSGQRATNRHNGATPGRRWPGVVVSGRLRKLGPVSGRFS